MKIEVTQGRNKNQNGKVFDLGKAKNVRVSPFDYIEHDFENTIKVGGKEYYIQVSTYKSGRTPTARLALCKDGKRSIQGGTHFDKIQILED